MPGSRTKTEELAREASGGQAPHRSPLNHPHLASKTPKRKMGRTH
jgi:hypothetical protein